MVSSSEVYLLTKITEIARRYGVKLSDCLSYMRFDEGGCAIEFAGTPTNPEDLEKFDKMSIALGIDDETGQVRATDVDELSDKLDQVLRLAPRKREL